MNRKYWLIAIVAVIVMLCAIGYSFAAPSCGPWTEIRDHLKEKYGEVPTSIAVVKSVTITFYVNPVTKTWTMIGQNGSSDTACEIMEGEGWEAAPAAVANPPVDDHPAIPKMREYLDGNGSKFWIVPVRR